MSRGQVASEICSYHSRGMMLVHAAESRVSVRVLVETCYIPV